MVLYYLTEMNQIKLENILLKFIFKEKLSQTLINGIVIKTVALMYNKHIDYYYSDNLATALNVPIKFVDNIYLRNQSKYYNNSLSELLKEVKGVNISDIESNKLEQNINTILNTKKKIHTKKPKRRWK